VLDRSHLPHGSLAPRWLGVDLPAEGATDAPLDRPEFVSNPVVEVAARFPEVVRAVGEMLIHRGP
jgi:hypothetical protein